MTLLSMPFNDNRLFMKFKNGGSWSAWREFAGVEQIPGQASAANATTDGATIGTVKLAASNNTTALDKAATPAGVAAQITSRITYGTSALTAGVSALTTGYIYLQYE
jgi:tetrahydromethanopterin S-methyltransferase subunit D